MVSHRLSFMGEQAQYSVPVPPDLKFISLIKKLYTYYYIKYKYQSRTTNTTLYNIYKVFVSTVARLRINSDGGRGLGGTKN